MPWETRSSTTTYDLVSHGGNTSGVNQCYGAYNDSSQTGWGPAFQYSCIHSGTIRNSGDVSTVWYNYSLASAGTIIDENTSSSNPATNINPATESICPKGWTLPTKAQEQAIGNNTSTYTSSFSPVLGGDYRNGTLYDEDTRGLWWGSTASSGALRYFLYYNGSSLSTSSRLRRDGLYVRCVAKQKTITDLAYMQDVTDELTTYDLVSHGTSTEGQNECYGSWNSTTEIGYGPAFVNSCLHSGTTEHSGGDTIWYNYVLASAGTIVNKDDADTAGNINTATESICPKGWTLPATRQIDSNRSVSNFSPVLGDGYHNGTIYNESLYGHWWGSEAYDGAKRNYLTYTINSNSLYTDHYSSRLYGFYIRCVSEEKTATDLTYMQDMMFANDNMVL